MRKEERLERLYASLPKVKCKGLCVDSCSAIPVQRIEAERMKAVAGRELSYNPIDMTCTYLREGKCTVHRVRPMICRLYGATADMACEHGCEVERTVGSEEATRLYREISKIDPVVFYPDLSAAIKFHPFNHEWRRLQAHYERLTRGG